LQLLKENVCCLKEKYLGVVRRATVINKIHTQKNFADRFKILLDTDMKIILLNHQNNFIGNFSWIRIKKIILLIYQNNYVERSKLLENQNFL